MIESSIVIYTKRSSRSSIILIDIFPTRGDGETSWCDIRIFTLQDEKKIRKKLSNPYIEALRVNTIPYNAILLENMIINDLGRIPDLKRIGEYIQVPFRPGTRILYKYVLR